MIIFKNKRKIKTPTDPRKCLNTKTIFVLKALKGASTSDFKYGFFLSSLLLVDKSSMMQHTFAFEQV